MEKLDTIKEKMIKLNDLTIETKGVDMSRVIERLNRIAKLKLDDFVGLSEGKFEHTIGEMFSLIKNLEGHLRHFIELSESLKGESVEVNLEKNKLAQDNDELNKKLHAIENSTPLVKDLEKKLDLAVEEVGKFRSLYKAEADKAGTMRADLDTLNSLLAKTKVERDDAYKQIVLLENTLGSSTKAAKTTNSN